jgi:hypothetical protein
MDGTWEDVHNASIKYGVECLNIPASGPLFDTLKRNTWKFKCKCGREYSPRIMDFLSGLFINCGKCEKWTYGRISNLIGKYFEIVNCPGKPEEAVKQIRKTYWDLICRQCNKPCKFLTVHLKYDRKSCGCLKREYNWEKSPGRPMVEDWTGKTNGYLEVLSRENEVGSDYILWKCRCKCDGKIVYVRSGNMPKTKSCGCFGRKHRSNRVSAKLEGKEFTELNVTDRAGVNPHGKVLWNVTCKCGVKKKVTSSALIGGHTKSCGHVKSHMEAELIKFLQENHTNVIANDRSVLGRKQELDAYLPDLKLGIELNGIYWHGELTRAKNGKSEATRSKLGCFDKYLKCKEKGIRLVNIFEDEWNMKKDVVKGYLLSILKKKGSIGAKKCMINKGKTVEFFDKYHLQGAGVGGQTYYLTYENEIVASAKFLVAGESRKMGIIGKVFELSRYCVRDISISGGASRLIKAFLKDNVDCTAILSYSDNRWSVGRLYEEVGFIKENEGTPTYWYVRSGNPNERFHRFNWTKTKAIKAYGGYPEDTEWDIMSRNGWDRVWDCGKTRWVYYVNKPVILPKHADIK